MNLKIYNVSFSAEAVPPPAKAVNAIEEAAKAQRESASHILIRTPLNRSR